MTKYFKNLIIPVTIIAIWYAISISINKFYLPSPVQVFGFFFNSLATDVFWTDLLTSVKRLSISLLISVPLSIGAGLLIGLNRTAYDLFSPIINFIRVMPITALLPLIIIAFGFSELSAIFIIILASGIQTLIAAIFAGQNVKIEYDSFIKILHLDTFTAATKVIIPASINIILPSIDLSINAAFRMLIVAELFGAQSGLGFRLIDSAQYMNFTQMYSTLFTVGILGLIINKCFNLCSIKILRWNK